jgi:hypothetical protein
VINLSLLSAYNTVNKVIGALDSFMGVQVKTLSDYVNMTFPGDEQPISWKSNAAVNFFNQQLYRDFNPDINGYTLCFLVPPDLSGYRINRNGNQNALYDQTNPESFVSRMGKLMCFAAIDFTPPQSQITSDTVKARTGGIAYASEVNESETVSITVLDNANLEIYGFHHLWVEYIREILEGSLGPDPQYYQNTDENYSSYYSIDYAASLYIVKYFPSMKQIKFISKCTGIYPQSMPSKELIGSRGANELTTLPFTYFCSNYRAMRQEFAQENISYDQQLGAFSSTKNFWIYEELVQRIFSQFNAPTQLMPNGVNMINGALNSFTNMYNKAETIVKMGSNITGFKLPIFK